MSNHFLQMQLQNQQSLANLMGQGAGGQLGVGYLGQAQALGAGQQYGQPASRYVSTIKHMELDVAEWLLDWDQ